jgi:hypothetical protein
MWPLPCTTDALAITQSFAGPDFPVHPIVGRDWRNSRVEQLLIGNSGSKN